jgi:hypothetical protein
MQLAALEDDPAAADLVQNLRRVLTPQNVEMIYADRGFAKMYDMVEHAVSKARAGMAARRRDYGRAAELARAPVRSLIDPAHDVINALLEEGDWRAAADIARDHDPRRKKVTPGFDDTRIDDYRDLYMRFAIAAAWSGDDSAAAEFLNAAEDAYRKSPSKEHDDADGVDRFSWPRTVLAGAAEGLLPRRYLNMLTHGFLVPF